MKRNFLRSVLAASLFSSLLLSHHATSDELPQPTIMGNNASIDLAYSAHEGESGYYLALDWQINKYAGFTVSVDSFLNGNVFNVIDDKLDADFDTETYGDGDFRPRQNTYTFDLALRYPFVLSKETIMAPYFSAGVARMSTKKLSFSTLGSGSGGTDETNNEDIDKTYSFDDLTAFKVSVGLQFAFDDTHKIAFGALSYINDDNWSDLVLEDNQTGASFKYEYRPNRALGYRLGIDSVDQFGNPVFRLGVNWVFN
jgi:hypothetical protein